VDAAQQPGADLPELPQPVLEYTEEDKAMKKQTEEDINLELAAADAAEKYLVTLKSGSGSTALGISS
jgi:hypothetical protein